MPDLKTTDEATRSPLDGNEFVRLATPTNNWKTTIADIRAGGGTGTNSTAQVNFASFGGVGDGITENAPAWNAFGTYARTQSAAGKAVILIINPGTYKYDQTLCYYSLMNIAKLHVIGYGATIQNNASNFQGNPWFYQSQPLRDGSNNYSSWFIQQTTPGASTFTLVTPSDTSNLQVGDWVMLASLDIQYNGYPPNCDQFEFVRITAINAGTGVITIAQTIRYQHRTDFPDAVPSAGVPCGKARVWQLNTLGWPVPGGRISWDIEHIYEGMTVNQSTSAFGPGPYAGFTGRSIRTINWRGVGFSESVIMDCTHESPYTAFGSEPDKLVGLIEYRDGWNESGIGFQSASIDRVRMIGMKIEGSFGTGGKECYVHDCDIASLGAANGQGIGRSTIISQSKIATYAGEGLGTSSGIVVDGSIVTFANGVFIISKATGSFTIANWNCIPGSQIRLNGPSDMFVGDIGTGIVLSITDDVNNFYISTTLPFATLPAWANGNGWVQRNNALDFINCTGCDIVRRYSAAHDAGKQPWAWWTFFWAGHFTAGNFWLGFGGIPNYISINVRQPTQSACTFNLDMGTVYDPVAVTSLGSYQLNINTLIRGQRIYTPTGFTGIQSGDTFTLNGVAKTTLQNVLVGREFASFFPAPAEPDYLQPIMEMEIGLDTGIFRRLLTQHTDDSGGSNRLIATQGGILP